MKTRMADFSMNIDSLIGKYTNYTLNNSEGIDIINEVIYNQLFSDGDDDEYTIYQELNDDTNPIYHPDMDEYVVNHHPFTAKEDKYLGRRVHLSHQSVEMHEAIIKKCKVAIDGSLIGTNHFHLMFDSREYNVDFTGKTTAEYTSNIIVENSYSQIDGIYIRYTSLSSICDQKSNANAVTMKMVGMSTLVVQKRVITSNGWLLKIEWKDGTNT